MPYPLNLCSFGQKDEQKLKSDSWAFKKGFSKHTQANLRQQLLKLVLVRLLNKDILKHI